MDDYLALEVQYLHTHHVRQVPPAGAVCQQAAERHSMQEMSPVLSSRVLDPPLDSVLLQICIKPPVCVGVCMPAKVVCQRGCLSEGGTITPIGKKEKAVCWRLLMSLGISMRLHRWLHMCLCTYHACTHALRPGLDELLCLQLHGSLARLRREIERGLWLCVGCVVSAAAVSHVLLCQGRVPWMFCCFRWLCVGDLETRRSVCARVSTR